MKINLQNKTAWVCGGSKGIGRSIAIELSKAGANIVLISRNKESLINTIKDLSIESGQVHGFVSIDLSDPVKLNAKINSSPVFKDVDILINNSGGPNGGMAHVAETEEYIHAFKQHLIAGQILTKKAAGIMKKKHFGRIINIISTSVKQPINGLGVSNTIRGAVANWSKTLASELGQYNITVNNVLPGATETTRLTSLVEKKATKTQVSTKEIFKNMKLSIPAGRFAKPEEIAYAALFLCSEYASYINGINLPIDGGRTKSL